jgi:hypothetical protein
MHVHIYINYSMKSKIHKHYTCSNSIQRRRVREQKKWTQLFNECEQIKSCTYVSTFHPEMKLRTLQHRYNLYKQNKNNQTKKTNKQPYMMNLPSIMIIEVLTNKHLHQNKKPH